jgi:integrase
MKVTTFTDTMIKKLKAEDKKYIRSEGNGFTVRVMPSGVKTWLYVYSINDKRRELNLGSYPDVTLETARGKFEDAKKLVKNGIDPVALIEQAKDDSIKALTVSKLAEEYMKRHAKINKRETSWTEDERLLNKNVLPAWGERKADSIKKRDCIALLDSFMDKPALCHNILKLTRKMFNFAVEKDILEHTPFTSVKAPVVLKERDRHLSEEEIRALWTVELPKAGMSSAVKNILKLCLLTGQRVGEVCGIHSKEVSGSWWTIPSERSKNKLSHRVYLTKSALDLLGEPKGYYFPSPKDGQVAEDGTILHSHIDENAVAYAIRRNLKNYVPRRPIKGKIINMVMVPEARKMDIAHFTPHDLRRTATTLLAKCKIGLEHRERVLNHKKGKLDGTYNMYDFDTEKQAALEELELKINCIISGTEYRNREQREQGRRDAEDRKNAEERRDNVVNIETARQRKAA